MAKDGTNRGGSRVGAGRKSKALADKIASGNPGGRKLTIVNFDDATSELVGYDMPPVKEFLKSTQKDGKDLGAEEIYKETWEWLKERGCERLISTQLLEQYSMCIARWIQCEEAISTFGFLAKHPTTGGAMTSPYVAVSRDYMKQSNQLWYQIYQVVKENCSVEYGGTNPQDDLMERLLTARKGTR